MTPVQHTEPIIILLAEDNPADFHLTAEAMKESKIRNQLFHVDDGVEVLEFLRRKGKYADVPRPDVILMDLNMPAQGRPPHASGDQRRPRPEGIPVVVLTVSDAEEDIIKSYDLHANCYVTKPMDLDEFARVVKGIEDFWFTIVKLPPNKEAGKA